jgi:hypothetical protein
MVSRGARWWLRESGCWLSGELLLVALAVAGALADTSHPLFFIPRVLLAVE